MLKKSFALALCALSAPAIAAPASAPASPAQGPVLGPWQMTSTGTGGNSMPGVFLLNTQTGELFVCMVVPKGGGEAGVNRGCAPMTPGH